MRVVRLFAAPIAAAALLFSSFAPAAARLLIEIDKSSQSMTVSQNGEVLHRWPVSTGIRAYATPSGAYTPFRMEKTHFSREWDDAPMPNSIFFTKRGHAIHGTNHQRAIGRPASHGCVRLELANARVLFDLVKRVGMANTSVLLSGDTADPRAPAMARAPRNQTRDNRAVYEERAAPEPDEAYSTRPDMPGRPYPVEVRDGYWVQYPDGSRVFVDRGRDPRLAPPPQTWGARPYGWQ